MGKYLYKSIAGRQYLYLVDSCGNVSDYPERDYDRELVVSGPLLYSFNNFYIYYVYCIFCGFAYFCNN